MICEIIESLQDYRNKYNSFFTSCPNYSTTYTLNSYWDVFQSIQLFGDHALT
jgi:hypothetical protein